MARLEMNNSITSFIRDLERAADNIPQLRKRMLEAEADILEPALRSAITSRGLVDTGVLRDSIGRSFRKKGTELLVGPSGAHHRYISRNWTAETVRAGHVGYIHEYGAPQKGIRPKLWMKTTVLKVGGKALGAAEAEYEKYLKNNNL